jgi:hypothetical protein
MAAAKGRKLKVYAAPFGFYDSVVAAPNQAEALAAWGMRQNLFAEGAARVAEDPKAIEAALAHPGTPLRRAIGSDAPFEVEPSIKPKAPKLPKATTSGKTAKAAKPLPEPQPPDRSDLDDAEAALRRLEDSWTRKKAELARRRAEFEAAAADAERSYQDDRKNRKRAVEDARKAYRKAGGRE